MTGQILPEDEAAEIVDSAFKRGTAAIQTDLLGTPKGAAALLSFAAHLQAAFCDALQHHESADDESSGFGAKSPTMPFPFSSCDFMDQRAREWMENHEYHERALELVVQMDPYHESSYELSVGQTSLVAHYARADRLARLFALARQAYQFCGTSTFPEESGHDVRVKALQADRWSDCILILGEDVLATTTRGGTRRVVAVTPSVRVALEEFLHGSGKADLLAGCRSAARRKSLARDVRALFRDVFGVPTAQGDPLPHDAQTKAYHCKIQLRFPR